MHLLISLIRGDKTYIILKKISVWQISESALFRIDLIELLLNYKPRCVGLMTLILQKLEGKRADEKVQSRGSLMHVATCATG